MSINIFRKLNNRKFVFKVIRQKTIIIKKILLKILYENDFNTMDFFNDSNIIAKIHHDLQK